MSSRMVIASSPDVRSMPAHRAIRGVGGPRLAGWAKRTIWMWPALLTLLVTLFQAGRAQLWRDELVTWSAASREIDDLLRMVRNIDAVSAPYYLVMHFWIEVFGDSFLALRAPSILCMTAAAAVTTMLGKRLFGTRAGLLAGLLFALVPSTSRYGQEARAYAPAALLAVLATLLLVRALERPGWWRWFCYGACVAALGLTHLIAFTIVAGHVVAVLLAWRRDRDRRALRGLTAVGAAGLAVLPLAWLARGQRHEQLDWVGTPTVGDIPALPGGVLQSGAVGGAMVALAAVGWATRKRWGWLLGLSALLPAGLLFVGGLITPLWVPRYLTFTVPLLCVLVGTVLAALRAPAALSIVALVALLGAPEQASLRRTHEWPRTEPVDYAGAAGVIGAHQQPGDGIVYSPRTGWGMLDVATAYHLPGVRPRDVLLAQSQRARGSLWAAECGQPAECLLGVDRVWVLARGEKTDPLAGMPAAKADGLKAGFRVDQVWNIPGLTVALLRRTGT